MLVTLNKHAKGVRTFKRSFSQYYRVMADDIRHLAAGKSSYNNTWVDWVGITSISSSTVIGDTIVTALAIAGVVTGFVSLGIGVAVACIGLFAALIFNLGRDYQKNKWYQSAERYLDQRNVDRHIVFVRAKVMNQFADTLNHCSAAVAKDFAKQVVTDISDAILYRGVR